MSDLGLYSLGVDNVVVFSFANISRLVDGPEEALQIVANAFFTTPGSNAFSRQDGGGFRQLMTGALGGDAELRTEAAVRVRRTMDTIRRNQSTSKPANATVTDLQVVDAVLVEDAIAMKIRIILLDGNSFIAQFKVT
jgi:hypothetical protein